MTGENRGKTGLRNTNLGRRNGRQRKLGRPTGGAEKRREVPPAHLQIQFHAVTKYLKKREKDEDGSIDLSHYLQSILFFNNHHQWTS